MNNTKGRGDQYGLDAYYSSASYYYGVETYSFSSFIHILSPLTKEFISKNNQNGNYNSDGTIQTVNSF